MPKKTNTGPATIDILAQQIMGLAKIVGELREEVKELKDSLSVRWYPVPCVTFPQTEIPYPYTVYYNESSPRMMTNDTETEAN